MSSLLLTKKYPLNTKCHNQHIDEQKSFLHCIINVNEK